MDSQFLTPAAANVIDQYLHLPFADKDVSTPYYNNRRKQVRGALRVLIGKGSPEDIYDEARLMALREKIDLSALTSEQIKQFLVDHHLGLDCSGLVYFVLQSELYAKQKKSLKSTLHFSRGLFRRFLSRLRSAENTNVATLASDKNTHTVTLDHARPGDLIVMRKTGPAHDRDHVCLIHQVDYAENLPTRLHYTHSFEWSTDGKYGHGVRQGQIDIVNPKTDLLEQHWTEQGKKNEANETFVHAKEATDLRLCRLNALT